MKTIRPALDVLHRLKETLTAKALSEAFAVSIRTVFRWLSLPLDFVPVLRSGRKRSLEESKLGDILSILKKTPCVTLCEIRHRLKIDVHVSTISLFLKKNRVTKKRGHTIFKERNEEAVQTFKRDSKTWSGRKMALDEASFSTNQYPVYGWAPRGQRAYLRRSGTRGKRFSLILCIEDSVETPIVGYRLVEGGFDASKFHSFVDEEISPRGTLIMDNASIHHAVHACRRVGKSTIGELLRSKSIDPGYLPPYSPTLNPVELSFNFIRSFARRKSPSTLFELTTVVEEAISALGKHVPAMFRHCFG